MALGGIGDVGIELEARGVDGREELLLDQFAMSRALFFGGTGRTIESVKLMLTDLTERLAPYSCSTRSISSSVSSMVRATEVGVGGITEPREGLPGGSCRVGTDYTIYERRF